MSIYTKLLASIADQHDDGDINSLGSHPRWPHDATQEERQEFIDLLNQVGEGGHDDSTYPIVPVSIAHCLGPFFIYLKELEEEKEEVLSEVASERMFKLAESAARYAHYTFGAPSGHEAEFFDECDHPDCKLVRGEDN